MIYLRLLKLMKISGFWVKNGFIYFECVRKNSELIIKTRFRIFFIPYIIPEINS